MTRSRLVNYGIMNMFASAFFFSLMNATAKALSLSITFLENMFFRGFFMVLFVALILGFNHLRNKRRSKSVAKQPRRKNKKGGYFWLCLRAFVGGLSMLAIFYNISTTSLGVSIAFAQSMPIYMAVLAFIFLREKINVTIALSVIIGFIGVILISDPVTDSLPFKNIAAGVFSGLSSAVAFMSLRALRSYFDELVVVLFFGLVVSIMSITLIMFDIRLDLSRLSPLGMREWILILVLGMTGTIAQWFLTRAYSLAPAAIVSPIDYMRIIFSLIFGIFLGDAIPNVYALSGMMLIILSGMLIYLPILIKDRAQHKMRGNK